MAVIPRALIEQPEMGTVCFFHWDPQDEEEKQRKAEEFNQHFEDFYRESQSRGKADCSGFVFPDKFHFYRDSDQDLLQTHFIYSKFGDGAGFDNAKIKPWTVFVGATFGSGASFNGATFEGHVNFDHATFGESAQFDHTDFSIGASFVKATFGPKVWFGTARFGQGTNFHRTEFGDSVSFQGAIFGDGIRFRYAKFLGSVNFTGAIVQGGLSFPGLEENHIFLGGPNKPVNFQRVRFERPEYVQFSTVDLRGASFFNTDISRVNFIDVIWPAENESISFSGRIEDDELSLPHQQLQFQRPHSATTLKWLEIVCQQLKLNFENKRSYAEAGEFHWAEMEYRRQRHWKNKKRGAAVMLEVYKRLSGYCERIPRTILWLTGVLVIAASAQGFLGVYHAPTWVVSKENFPCVSLKNRNFRRIGILSDSSIEWLDQRKDACPLTETLVREILFHAGKFTLLSASFQRPDEYEAATRIGRGLSLLMRIFFPIQLGLLLVAIKRRFRR